MKIRKITPKDLKTGIEWLWSNRKHGGCFHFVVWTEPDFIEDVSPTDYNVVPNPNAGREYSIVIGWLEAGPYTEDDKKAYFVDGDWALHTKIGYQNRNNVMSCDFGIDFDMPYGKEDGIVYDTCEILPRGPNGDEVGYYGSLAEDLNNQAKKVVEYVVKHKEELG